MTPERIADLAHECKFAEYYEEGRFVDYASVTPRELETFAIAIAREARREALEEAARVCAHNAELYPVPGTGWESSMECAAAIRALADAPDAGAGGRPPHPVCADAMMLADA